MSLRKYFWIFVLAGAPFSWASLEKDSACSLRDSFSKQERVMESTSRTSGTEYAAIAHLTPIPDCSATQPPEALATPDPLLSTPNGNSRITVSFIIGTDGRVHSPLILESAGDAKDRAVLDTVRSWRYRPAMCNGVPTETEGKIEFSSR
jgi:TonB family protein